MTALAVMLWVWAIAMWLPTFERVGVFAWLGDLPYNIRDLCRWATRRS